MSTFFYKIYNNIWIKSIRRGLLKVQPVILINCIFIILININSDLYTRLMGEFIFENWKEIFEGIYGNLNMISKVLIVISINIELAKIRKHEKQYIKYMGNSVSTNMVGFMGLASAVTFSSIVIMKGALDTGSSVIIEANWTILSIMVSMIFSEVYIKIYYYIIDKKKNVINSYDKIVRQSILAILEAVKNFVYLIFFLEITSYLFNLDKLLI